MSSLRERIRLVVGRSTAEPGRGTVTVEFAVPLPLFGLLLTTLLAMGAAGAAQLRCVDAARSAARLAARHESAAVVLAGGRSARPRDAVVQVSAEAGLVRVRVSAKVPLPLPGRPEVSVSADAVAHLEPTAVGDPE